ncbi:MAG: hypothetical protein AB1589_38035, partial [Cyanobacteriota bacterium]
MPNDLKDIRLSPFLAAMLAASATFCLSNPARGQTPDQPAPDPNASGSIFKPIYVNQDAVPVEMGSQASTNDQAASADNVVVETMPVLGSSIEQGARKKEKGEGEPSLSVSPVTPEFHSPQPLMAQEAPTLETSPTPTPTLEQAPEPSPTPTPTLEQAPEPSPTPTPTLEQA